LGFRARLRRRRARRALPRNPAPGRSPGRAGRLGSGAVRTLPCAAVVFGEGNRRRAALPGAGPIRQGPGPFGRARRGAEAGYRRRIGAEGPGDQGSEDLLLLPPRAECGRHRRFQRLERGWRADEGGGKARRVGNGAAAAAGGLLLQLHRRRGTRPDPELPNQMPDGYGGTNSLLLVKGEGAI
jgi:hypothetical protein